jgi:hypothetical protein
MTTALQPTRLRFACNSRSHSLVTDKLTGAAAIIWRGVPVDVEFVLYVDTALVDDKSNLSAVYFELHATPRSSAPLVQKTLVPGDLDMTISEANWLDGTKEHGTFALAHADTQVDFATASDEKRNLFWVIHALTTDNKYITCGCGQITIEEDGAQNDLAVLGASNPTVAVVDGDLRIKNRTTGEWRNIWIEGAGDEETLKWGPV